MKKYILKTNNIANNYFIHIPSEYTNKNHTLIDYIN